MAKDLYNGPLDKNMDFTNPVGDGRPASGLAVQNYIKDIDSRKYGVGFTLEDGTAHLIFADEEDMEAYINDPTREDLIKDRIELEPMYYMTVTPISDLYNIVFEGDKGNVIQYDFETVNRTGQPIAEAVTVTYVITRGATTRTITQNYNAGSTASFNVDDYILSGNNNIFITLKGQITKISTSFSVVYQVINLSLSDTMDISHVYKINDGDNRLQIPYTVSGVGQKTMEWYIDGERVPFVRDEDEINDSESSRTKYINIIGLNQRHHSLQFRVGINASGIIYYSTVRYREFIVDLDQQGDPIVVTATDFPSGVPVLGPSDSLVIQPTQFEPFPLRLSVFNPSGQYQNEVIVSVDNNTVASVMCTEGEESVVSLTLTKTGEGMLTFGVGGYSRDVILDVNETPLNIHEIVADLEMNFTAEGKSNTSVDRDTWTDGTYHADLIGFDWTDVSGWVDNSLIIPSNSHIDFDIQPLLTNPTIDGFTIEMDFKTINVDDENAVLIDLINPINGAGIKLTSTEVSVCSRGGLDLNRRYKTNEDLRVSIVINRAQGTTLSGLAQVYFNGILSITQNFAESDQFICSKALSVGGVDAGIILRQIRIYGAALNADQIINNFILYRPNINEMMSVYERNDLYESGQTTFDINKIAGYLPVMIITGDLTPIETATDTKATTVVDIDYTNLQNPEYSFRMYHAQMRPQGTSSLTYPRKNLRLYTNKRDDTVVYDYEGKVIANKKYAFKPGAQPVNCWTIKADFAESSGTHNTGVARIWNDVMKQTQVGGEYVLRTEAQQTALDEGYPYDVRTTVDGFPIVIFHRLTADDPLTFLGKYNFNNDKSTESVFGFKDIPGFDNTNVNCWEFRDSGFDLALFRTPQSGRTYAEEFDYYASDYENLFSQVWESRYPDTSSPSYTHLRRLALWLNSTEGASQLVDGKLAPGDPAKFSKWQTEKTQYFDLPKLAAYYVYLIRFGAVDQTVKNSMITTEDGDHWYFINYDNDTILGVRNDGLLRFGYDINRQSRDPQGGFAYAGHDSVLWNNFEADPECMEMVRTIDSALFSAGLTYEEMIKMFNEYQAGKWAESVYNKDAMYKYIEPYLYQDKNYLGSLQGSRSDHRKWWISNRFALYDAIYANSSYEGTAITLLIDGAPRTSTLTIEAGRDFYFGWGQNRIPMEIGVWVEKDQNHTFTLDMNWQIGTPLRIYAPSDIKTLDLGNVMQYIGENINLNAAWSETLGSKMKTLILGVDNPLVDLRRNNKMSGISGISSIFTLENINVAGFQALKTLDLSTLSNLKTFKSKASGLTSIQFANGAPLTQVELPATLQVLNLNSLPQLTTTEVDIEGDAANVYSINIHNCPKISNSPSLLLSWIDNKVTPDEECSVVMDNIVWRNTDPLDLLKIGQIKENGGNLSLRGTCNLTTTSQEVAQQLMDIFGASAFQPGAEFYITAPDAVYVTGPTEVLEGQVVQYTAAVFSHHPGTVAWSILSGYRPGVTINEETGVLTTIENGQGDATLVIRCIHTPTEGQKVYADLQIRVKGRVYPSASQTSITGNSQVVVGNNIYYVVFSTTGITGDMIGEWSLSGDLTNYASIDQEHSDETHGVMVVSDIPGEVSILNGVLSVTLKKRYNGQTLFTKTKEIVYVNDDIAISSTINPLAMAVMYEAGLAAHSTYMTKTEAANVTELDIQPGESSNSSIFTRNTTAGYAFKNNCRSFDEFQYFTGLSYIPKYLFYQCYALKQITLPPNIITINLYAFYSCPINNIIIPEGVTEIQDQAFSYCTSLTDVNFPNSLQIIGNYAFSATKLTSIFIGKNVSSISNSAFTASGVDTVSSIDVDPDNEYYYGRGYNCIVEKQSRKLIKGCKNTIIPSDTLVIGSSSFSWVCQNYESPSTLVIPSGVTEIQGQAFSYSGVIINDLPNTITKIGDSAFSNCTGISSLDLSNVTSIGSSTFQGSSIVSVSNLNVLSSMIFYNCVNLTSFHVPKSATYLDRPISGCYNIETITVDPENSVYEGNGYNCVVRKSRSITVNGVTSSTKALEIGCKNTVFPDDVSVIYTGGEEAFVNAPENITNSFIPSRVYYIFGAFKSQSSIKTVDLTFSGNCYIRTFLNASSSSTTLSNSLTSIHIECNGTLQLSEAISNLYKLEYIKLESTGDMSLDRQAIYYVGGNAQVETVIIDLAPSIVSIENYALHATKKYDVYCRAITPPSLNSGALNNSYLQHIYVPSSSVNTYKEASNWSNYSSKIEAIPSE